jgi:hypothetical protein
MLITWDDDTSDFNNSNDLENDILNIPKYKFQSGINNDLIKNNIIAANVNDNVPIEQVNQSNQVNPTQSIQQSQSLSKKYNIFNKFDLNPISRQNIGNSHNLGINANKSSKSNIFISHKNPSKYSVKF